MTDKRYADACYVSAFQPLSVEDQNAITLGLDISEHVTIVVGSSTSSRSSHLNPFSLSERLAMINLAFRQEIEAGRVSVMPLADLLYADRQWARSFASAAGLVLGDASRAILAAGPTRTGYFQRAFPTRDVVTVDAAIPHAVVKRAALDRYFAGADLGNFPLVPESVKPFLHEFRSGNAFPWLAEESASNARYVGSWASSPFPPKFITADAVIECQGRILMVRRGAWPGKGLWALPGGFLEEDERVDDAAVRELSEETGLDLDTTRAEADGWLKANGVFDLPNRDGRGRLVTHGYYFSLPDATLPPVEAGDDADEVRWTIPEEIDPLETMADHFAIIQRLRAT